MSEPAPYDFHVPTVDELVGREPRPAVKPLKKPKPPRAAIRILFISRDESLLNQANQSLDGYLALGDVFDEVHICILRTGIKARTPVLRVEKNVWLYVAAAENWWWTPIPGGSMIDEQLQFADGFRPDLIVARDPFESAVLAYMIAERYGRVTQIHVTEDFTDPDFLLRPGGKIRAWLAKQTIRRTNSVRTSTTGLESMIRNKFPHLTDLETLPRLNNFSHLEDQPALIDVRQRYPQYKFLYVFVGALTHKSSLPMVLDALRAPLINRTVGLIVVGNGPSIEEYQRRAELLGIAPQVVFAKEGEDVLSYLKAADVVVTTDTDAEADEVVVQAAALGKAMVLRENDLRSDLFRQQESAYLVPVDSPYLVTTYCSELLNNETTRRQVGEAAKAVANTRFHDNRTEYREAYKQSIEKGLLLSLASNATL